jgi:hypothetical protein
MLIMRENVGGLPHRSDEIHALIGAQFLDLGYFCLNLSRIRLIGSRHHVQLLLGLIDAALLRRAPEKRLLLESVQGHFLFGSQGDMFRMVKEKTG